jgi:hypothetical protein
MGDGIPPLPSKDPVPNQIMRTMRTIYSRVYFGIVEEEEFFGGDPDVPDKESARLETVNRGNKG